MRLIISLMLVSSVVHGQSESNQWHTNKYAGAFTYSKGKNGPTGSILIYPESDTTVLFYADINRGAPSYNSGSLYNRIKIANGQGTYVSKDHGCRWTIQFFRNKLTIKTENNSYDCGFGNGVVIDESYGQISTKVPDYFADAEGKKHFFKTTRPEKYYKE